MPASDRVPDPRAKPQQHGLGLVVEGVPEQDARRAKPLGDLVEGRVARGSRGRFGSGLSGRDVDWLRLDRVEPEL